MHLPIKGNRVILKLLDRGRSLSHGAMNLGNKLRVSWENTEHPEEEDKCQGQERRGRSHQCELSRVSSARPHFPPGDHPKATRKIRNIIFSKTGRQTWKYLQGLPRSPVHTGAKEEKARETKQRDPGSSNSQRAPSKSRGCMYHMDFLQTKGLRGADRSPYLRRGSETVGAAEKPLAPVHRIWWHFQRKEHLHCFPTASTLGPFFASRW